LFATMAHTDIRYISLNYQRANIMRNFRIWFIAAACVTAIAPFSVYAQQAAATSAPPPPELQKLDDGNEPGITIRPSEGEQKITEKRQSGKTTEVKVQKGKNVYTVRPNDQVGSVLPGDTQATSTRPAQWVVKEFGKKKPPVERNAPAAQPAPPPPTVSDLPPKAN